MSLHAAVFRTDELMAEGKDKLAATINGFDFGQQETFKFQTFVFKMMIQIFFNHLLDLRAILFNFI